MAAVLATNRCYGYNVELINNEGKSVNSGLSFSSSVSVPKLLNYGRPTGSSAQANQCLQVEMRQAESSSSKLGINGRSVKMVPVSEVMKKHTSSTNKPNMVNGVNGSKPVVNGPTLVRKYSTPAATLVKSQKSKTSKELPPRDELKVLPSDENFSWANENYNSLQRSADVWSFVLSLRVRILLDNAKWAYQEVSQKISRKSEDEKLPHGCGSVYCSLDRALSNLDNCLPHDQICFRRSLWNSLPSYRTEFLPSHLPKRKALLRLK